MSALETNLHSSNTGRQWCNDLKGFISLPNLWLGPTRVIQKPRQLKTAIEAVGCNTPFRLSMSVRCWWLAFLCCGFSNTNASRSDAFVWVRSLCGDANFAETQLDDRSLGWFDVLVVVWIFQHKRIYLGWWLKFECLNVSSKSFVHITIVSVNSHWLLFFCWIFNRR